MSSEEAYAYLGEIEHPRLTPRVFPERRPWPESIGRLRIVPTLKENKNLMVVISCRLSKLPSSHIPSTPQDAAPWATPHRLGHVP